MHLDGIEVPDAAFTELLRKYHVKQLALFGSRARGDYRSDSDVDFLVDFVPGSRIDLIQFSELQLELQKMLGIPVDLVSRGGLKPRMKDRVLGEARPVYAIG
ncbi:MAG TPA: nucleotidyltransferase family protein [Candidatus Kapabacteria bacterium]|nr:nucleotidyltransferase family protein [Candidatus Kapabacteria bacterium]